MGIIVSAAADHLYHVPIGIFDCVIDYVTDCFVACVMQLRIMKALKGDVEE